MVEVMVVLVVMEEAVAVVTLLLVLTIQINQVDNLVAMDQLLLLQVLL